MATKKNGRGRSLILPKGIKINSRNKIEALQLVSALPDASVKLAFLDPQYRTGLDHLKFGNEGARQKARAELPQQTDVAIRALIEDICRTLKPSGHLMLWGDKYAFGQGMHLRYIHRLTRVLQIVDVCAWDKLAIGMGRRFRCRTEYLIVLQKIPLNADKSWIDHTMPDCWHEKKDRARHPHAKPIGLITRLIETATKRGDLVLDPCAGGFGVLEACGNTGRDFIGGDLRG